MKKLSAYLDHPKWIMIEFIALCLSVPSVIIIFGLGAYMFAFLWIAFIYCLIIYRLKYFPGWKTIWKFDAFTKHNLKLIFFRWIVASIGIFLFTWCYEPERLFYIPKNKPELIPVLIFAYTLISALPQEFIFCSFFFERFQNIFKTPVAKIIASAIVFAYAHILFINWIAPIFSFFGGIIFAHTYYKTRSLALITLEHGLYGNSLFIIGLGWYFYSGTL